LGVLFNTNYHREFGERPDFPKARDYFAKALAEEPERIGYETIRARAGRGPAPDLPRAECFERRLENYQWLTSLDERAIRTHWLPRRKGQTEPTDDDLHSFMDFLRHVISAETDNLVVRREPR